jgi:hypothetical protein
MQTKQKSGHILFYFEQTVTLYQKVQPGRFQFQQKPLLTDMWKIYEI